MADYKRLARKFVCRGIQLRPPDLLEAYKFARLKNVRSPQEGILQNRSGYAQVNAAALSSTSLHSIRRMNDKLPAATNPFIRVIGDGTHLFAGVNAFADIDSGYSGNPLALVPYRPEQSPQSWMYVADSARMRKVNMDATTNYGLGIAAPNTPPTAALATPNAAYMEDFEYANDGALQAVWIEGGTAGNPTRLQWRLNTTITAAPGILFDTGTTGWACIGLTAPAGVLPGSRVRINAAGGTAETVLVHDAFAATSGTITIASIIYDNAPTNTGACSIVLSVPVREVQVDSLIMIAAAEVCRVLSVTIGPDGLTCIRTSTVSTRAATNAIVGLASFRAYCVNTHAAGETVTQDAMVSAITTGTGYLTSTAIVTNLSMIGGRPVQSSDYLQFGILATDPSKITSGKIMFDIDVAGSGAGTIFQRNFFYYEFRASDFVPAAQSSQTLLSTRQRAIQRQIVDQAALDAALLADASSLDNSQAAQIRANALAQNPDLFTNFDDPNLPPDPSTSGQTDSGQVQWTQFRVPLSVLEANRVGSDLTRTWKDMSCARIQFIVTGNISIYLSAILVSGTYGPDIGTIGSPFIYRYRAESSVTGAASNPSPPMRAGKNASRERVTLSLTTVTDAQADKLRIERFGGNIQGWHDIGTTANTGTPTFNDDQPDGAISGSPPLALDNHQPFPTIDTPKSGTCNVAGTSVFWISGSAFNVSWGRGTIINIAGVDYTFYNQPASTTFLQLNENAGSGSAVVFYIKEPILLAQPLPSLWGPHPLIDVLFACGSPYQPGTLFWTKPGNADAAPIAFNQEVTPPTEPLINGLMMPDGRSLVWSSERNFAIYPALNNVSTMTILEAGKRGLFAAKALCTGEGKIWFRSKDGIYETGGGNSGESITDADLYVLFPHNDASGTDFADYFAPDDTHPEAQRLAYCDGYLYFDYLAASDAKYHRLVYRIRDKSWWPDVLATEMLMTYAEEGDGVNSLLFGGRDGRVHLSGGTTDNGTAIPGQVRSGSEDADDSRIEKQFGDLMLDFLSAVNVTATIGFNNYVTTIAPQVVTNSTRNVQVVVDFSSGQGYIARNIALDLAWASSGPVLYEWQPSFLPRVENIVLRGTDYDDCGYQGSKFFQGCIIECDTGGVDQTVQVLYDGTNVGATLTVNANGQMDLAFPFTAFIGHQVRLVATGASQWRFFSVRWIWEPVPELVTRWETQPTTHDFDQYFQWDQPCFIALISSAIVTLAITLSDATVVNYSIASTGGLYAKPQVEFTVMKTKNATYTLTSASGFRLFQRDCSVRVKGWGDPGDYRMVNPFGDLSRLNGARI